MDYNKLSLRKLANIIDNNNIKGVAELKQQMIKLIESKKPTAKHWADNTN